MTVSIGTAGWNVPRDAASGFTTDGTHLQRYARTMRCVEINSSFHRPHRTTTYRRWATETPDGFRFAVKLPRAVTHDARLVGIEAPLDAFLGEVAGLGDKLGVLLVQLAPSHAFAAGEVEDFLHVLRRRHAGAVVCEPRHASWFTDDADETMRRHRVGRVAADPALSPRAAMPGGWLGPRGDGVGATPYWRWHGSPRTYWSDYDDAWIAARAAELRSWSPHADCWCVFDNTAAGRALPNALALASMPGD